MLPSLSGKVMSPGREYLVWCYQSVISKLKAIINYLVLVGAMRPPVALIPPHQSVIRACIRSIIVSPDVWVSLAAVTRWSLFTKTNHMREITAFEIVVIRSQWTCIYRDQGIEPLKNDPKICQLPFGSCGSFQQGVRGGGWSCLLFVFAHRTKQGFDDYW